MTDVTPPKYKIDLQSISIRESEQVEWKRNVADINELVSTIVAFANDYSNLGGGYVVCGAEETKDEHGFQRLQLSGLTADRLKEIEGTVLTLCRERVEPPLVPIVEELPAGDDSKRVLVFIVPASQQAHSFRANQESNQYFIRISRETRIARNGLLRELLVRKGSLQPWDKRMNPGASLEDLDLLVFREYLKRMGLWDARKGIEPYLHPDVRLATFVPSLAVAESMTKVVRPRNFALILFGSEPTKFFPGAHSVFSIYPGIDRSEPHAERLTITGSILEQASKLIERLNTEATIVFDKTSDRPNLPKYPRRALQEAVVNALVHRDYEIDRPTRVTVFSDRIEIDSPGTLPSAVDRSKFILGQAAPLWRNQTLAYFFNKIQLAQAEGQGIPTIIRTMNEEGCPPPVFEVGAENVLCVLPAHPRHKLVRELTQIENQIVLGNHAEAIDSLQKILERDIYNFRALELFCEVNSLAGTPERVFNFLVSKNVSISNLNASTQFVVGQTLASVINPSSEIRSLANQLLTTAANSRLEENEIRRIAVSFRKLGKNETAIDLIDRVLKANPGLSKNSHLLDIRAKSKIDLAKRCMETARNRNSSQDIRRKAWDQCRRYLEDAERDLTSALENVGAGEQRQYIQRDLDFLSTMKEVARKPTHRQSGRRSR